MQKVDTTPSILDYLIRDSDNQAIAVYGDQTEKKCREVLSRLPEIGGDPDFTQWLAKHLKDSNPLICKLYQSIFGKSVTKTYEVLFADALAADDCKKAIDALYKIVIKYFIWFDAHYSSHTDIYMLKGGFIHLSQMRAEDHPNALVALIFMISDLSDIVPKTPLNSVFEVYRGKEVEGIPYAVYDYTSAKVYDFRKRNPRYIIQLRGVCRNPFKSSEKRQKTVKDEQ